MIDNRRIFNYDYIRPAWNNHEELLTHNGQECYVSSTDFGRFDVVHVVFKDGFEANVFIYELDMVD